MRRSFNGRLDVVGELFMTRPGKKPFRPEGGISREQTVDAPGQVVQIAIGAFGIACEESPLR